jgi:hypothetical protein
MKTLGLLILLVSSPVQKRRCTALLDVSRDLFGEPDVVAGV